MFGYDDSLKEYVDPDKCRVFNFKGDYKHLEKGYLEALPFLVKASLIADELFLMQDHPQSVEVKRQLGADVKNGVKNAQIALEVFKMFNGPEGLTYENEVVPLFKEVNARPKSGTLITEGVTAEEIEEYLKKNPKEAEEFKKINTLIEKKEGKLITVKYEERYKNQVKEIASLLENAAKFVPDVAFKKYLSSRAKALVDGDYYQSDIDWIRSTDCPLDFIVGPLESYGDRILGKKAFYAALLCVKNVEESQRVAEYMKYLQELEDDLPQVKERAKMMKNISLPVAVVDVLCSTGDYQAKRPGLTVGQTLPNDKEVLDKVGRKILIYKNVLEGFTPNELILQKLIDPSMHKYLTSRGKVNFVVSHEVSHSLGPKKTIKKDQSGNFIAIDTALEKWDAIIEELKSDIVGMYNMPYLVKKGVYTEDEMGEVYADGVLRSLPVNQPDIHKDAHRVGDLMKLNYYMAGGALIMKEKKFLFVKEKFHDVTKRFVADVIQVQAEGSKEKAEAFIRKWTSWNADAEYTAKMMKECKTKLYKQVNQPLIDEILNMD